MEEMLKKFDQFLVAVVGSFSSRVERFRIRDIGRVVI